jgi:Na+/H+-dicarboxylate symporter
MNIMKTQFSARSPQTGKACKLYDFKFLSVGPFQSFALYFLHSPVLGVSIMALLTSSVSENITYIKTHRFSADQKVLVFSIQSSSSETSQLRQP